MSGMVTAQSGAKKGHGSGLPELQRVNLITAAHPDILALLLVELQRAMLWLTSSALVPAWAAMDTFWSMALLCVAIPMVQLAVTGQQHGAYQRVMEI